MTITARLLISVVLCLIGAAHDMTARAEVAAAAATPAPLGLDVDGASYALVSNKRWTLGGGPAAREVKVVRRAIPGAGGAFSRQDEAYIWALTCTPQAQQVTFRRVFFLPGPPKTFGAQFQATNSDYASSRPIGSFRLKINGQLVLSVAGSAMTSGIYTIAEAANNYAKAIQYGENVVEVEVSKIAQTPANSRCVEASTLLGFRFQVYGRFEADLFLSNTPNTPQDCYYKATNPAKSMNVSVGGRFATLRNLGPSGAYRGHISIQVVATGSEEMVITSVGTMGMTCEIIEQGKVGRVLECDIDPWASGLSPGLKFLASATLALSNGVPVFSKPLMQVKAYLESKTGDPKYNHKDEFRAHFCQPWSTDPKCRQTTACKSIVVTNQIVRR